MAYKTKLGKPDSKGNFKRDLGRWIDGRQPRFYLGKDPQQAERRKARLEQVWEIIEATNDDPCWNQWTYRIALAIAAGESSVTLPMLPPFRTDLEYSTLLDMYIQGFGKVITILPEDADAYRRGKGIETEKRREFISLSKGIWGSTSENILEEEPAMLHEALDRYAEHIKRKYKEVGTDKITDWGLAQLQTVERLKERHEDRPLARIDFTEIKEMIHLWQSRPQVKGRKTPISADTARHHIAQLKNFLWWVNDESSFRWKAPSELARLKIRIPRTEKEKQGKVSPAQVPTWTVEELTTLYQYATPLERVFLLLGMNCGFAVAEFGSLRLNQIFLHQKHGWDSHINYESRPDQSWIKRIRLKNGVYGEWLLWPHTVTAIEWAIERRKSQPGFAPDAILMLTQRGLPYIGQTKGGNHSTRISSLWYGHLLKRVKTKTNNEEFRSLPPKSLRKTSGNMIRDIADGEVMAVFHTRGQAVKTDDLAEIYSNRPFRKVFEAIEEMGRRLQPLWDAVPEPFPTYRAEDGAAD